MEIGESSIIMGNHATAGPIRIEVYQPMPIIKDNIIEFRDVPEASELDYLRQISGTLDAIYFHLTRPNWWIRLYRKVKQLCGIH